MASSRSAMMMVMCMLLLLVVADVAKADLPQQQAPITGRKHLRGDDASRFSAEVEAAEAEAAANESLESFERRELADYSPKANCSGNCKK